MAQGAVRGQDGVGGALGGRRGAEDWLTAPRRAIDKILAKN